MESRLPTTRWTLIARLRASDEPLRNAALEELCSQYHYPLYCYIRRSNLDHHDAQDALHEFFSKLLRNETFAEADPEKGRLRTFLLSSLRRFLINWRRDQRHRHREISGDTDIPPEGDERRYRSEPFIDTESPDLAYDRQWAREVIGATLRSLREKYTKKGRENLFDALRPVLLTGGSMADHDSASIAAGLGMKRGALRMALMRLLDDFRVELRNEIAQTVEDPEKVKDELKYLLEIFVK